MADILRRYFVANRCPILSIKRSPRFNRQRIPANGGNFGGFYWLWFHVTWRRPYRDCWQYNPERKRWETAS